MKNGYVYGEAKSAHDEYLSIARLKSYIIVHYIQKSYILASIQLGTYSIAYTPSVYDNCIQIT